MNPIEKMQSYCTDQHLDAILISSVPNIIYLTNYAGFSIEEREAYVLVTKQNTYLLTDARYINAVNNMPHITLCEITATTPLTALLTTVCEKEALQKIGIETTNLTVAEYHNLKKLPATLSSADLRNIRLIKTAAEIAAIQQACALGDQAFDHVLSKIVEGVTEKQIAFELEFFIKQHGGDISFRSITAFGPHAAIPHHHTSDTPLTKNNFVLLDFGVKIDNYCSDMTRTIFLGTPTDEQKKMHQTVWEAQQKAIDYFGTSTSITAADVDRIARDYILSQQYPSIPHSLGHGIGLAVHEAPSLSPHSKDILTDGMVFSIEPGIYLPGFGGVRIEDLFVIENSKLRQLTTSPKTCITL